jgi:hypothetical protein
MHFSQFATQLRCVHCGNTHRAYQWPLNGDRTALYFQKEEGNYNLPVTCPKCQKEWYVVWDQDPGPIMPLIV